MNFRLNLVLSSTLFLMLSACKTTQLPESSLQGETKKPEAGDEIIGCFKVMKVDSPSTLSIVTKLKEKASQLCIRKKPIDISIRDVSNQDLLTWQFTEIAPLRCPGCFAFKGGQEYAATITGTAVPLIFNMSLESRGLGGPVRLSLQQILEKSNAQAASPAPFRHITCGDHWNKVRGVMPTESKPAVIELDGDSRSKVESIPAKVLRKTDELVFEATNGSGIYLRIVNSSGDLYGVFRSSKLNDETDLGICHADIKAENPLN